MQKYTLVSASEEITRFRFLVGLKDAKKNTLASYPDLLADCKSSLIPLMSDEGRVAIPLKFEKDYAQRKQGNISAACLLHSLSARS